MVKRLVLLSALVMASVGCSKPGPTSLPPSAASPLLGKTSPDFSRPTLAGSKFDTENQRGSVIVVKFFAEYCAPCKRTLPAAEALHQRYPDVAFVGVSEDELQRQAESMVSTYGLSFPVVLDRGNVLAGRFRVVQMPTTFVLDREGKVRWVGGPGHTEDDLKRAVEAIRDQAPAQ